MFQLENVQPSWHRPVPVASALRWLRQEGCGFEVSMMKYTLRSRHKTKSNVGSYCLLSTSAVCLQSASYTTYIKAALETGKMAQRVEVIVCQAWGPGFNPWD